MTTILNISAYKFEVLDQQPILQEQRLAATLRRGSTPEGFRRFAEMIGVSKSDGWIDYSVLEECIRDHLNDIALRLVSSGSNAKTFKRCPRKLTRREHWPRGRPFSFVPLGRTGSKVPG